MLVENDKCQIHPVEYVLQAACLLFFIAVPFTNSIASLKLLKGGKSPKSKWFVGFIGFKFNELKK